MAELNESNIASGRDETGKFISKKVIQDLASKAISGYQKQIAGAEKQLDALRKTQATTAKQANSIVDTTAKRV